MNETCQRQIKEQGVVSKKIKSKIDSSRLAFFYVTLKLRQHATKFAFVYVLPVLKISRDNGSVSSLESLFLEEQLKLILRVQVHRYSITAFCVRIIGKAFQGKSIY